MPFGSGDREVLSSIGRQLGEVLTALSALKQQVDDQQHSINQMRQETTAAVTTGLNDVRAVNRRGLEQAVEPLTRINRDLESIHESVHRLDHEVRASMPRPAEPDTPTTEPAPQPDIREDILHAAAGISAAKVKAHRDLWAFIVEHVGQDPHFHIPGGVEEAEGAVTVWLSGPSVVAAIMTLAEVGRNAPSPVTRALAGYLHTRLTGTVVDIIDNPHRGRGADPVTIVIDDRAKPAEEGPPERPVGATL
ncbi:hypothetical protein [Streptomyces sp. NPDC002644]